MKSWVMATDAYWPTGPDMDDVCVGRILNHPVSHEYGKVRCEYCGKRQDATNDECKSCGANLPDIIRR